MTGTETMDGVPRLNLEESVRVILSDDHARLERSFVALVIMAEASDQGDLRQAWESFERELLAHMNAEERHLIEPFRRQEPAEADALLREHEEIRAKLTEMGIDLELHCLHPEQVAAIVASLRVHARREERALYPWAVRQLGEVARARVERALATARSTDASGVESMLWRIDPTRSTLGFSLRHIVVHRIHGSFRNWGGKISLDPSDPSRPRVDVWVDLGSIETGDLERDDHVRSAEFLDVAQFPRAVFRGQSVGIVEERAPVIRGVLSLHGVEADVPVEITATEIRVDPAGGARRLCTIKASLDRRQFGLRWNQDLDVGGVVVGDEVEIVGHAELVHTNGARPG